MAPAVNFNQGNTINDNCHITPNTKCLTYNLRATNLVSSPTVAYRATHASLAIHLYPQSHIPRHQISKEEQLPPLHIWNLISITGVIIFLIRERINALEGVGQLPGSHGDAWGFAALVMTMGETNSWVEMNNRVSLPNLSHAVSRMY